MDSTVYRNHRPHHIGLLHPTSLVGILPLWLLTALFFISILHSHASHAGSMPPSIRVVLAKAATMMNAERYAEAITLIDGFLAKKAPGSTTPGTRDPHLGEVYSTLGACHLLAGNNPSAKKALEIAVKLNPEHTSAWLNLGKAAYDIEDYNRAATAFDQAFSHSPEPLPDHLYYSAVCFLMAEDHERSIRQFDRLLSTFPERIDNQWLEQYVHALLAVDRHRQALPHIHHLADMYTGDKKIQWQEILLHCYLQLEMFREATDYANLLTESAPTQVKWWKALASIQMHNDAYEKALAALIISGFLAPPSEQERKLVADLFLQVGIPSQAVPLYQALLKDNTDHRAILNLVIALRQLDQNQQALDMLKTCARDSKDPQLLAQHAELLFTLERYDEAISTFERLAEIDKGHEKHAREMIRYARLQTEQIEQDVSGIETQRAGSKGMSN